MCYKYVESVVTRGVFSMLHRGIIGLVLVLAVSIVAAAQAKPVTPRPNDQNRPATSEDKAEQSGSEILLPEEMRVKMEIERAESEHRKFVEDVTQLSDLSNEVSKRYHDSGNLSSDELKKLANMEKIAKRILNHAGGKGDDSDEPSELSLATAIDQMHEAVADIKKNVMAQSRYVVSTTLIASSNQVIRLARFVRRVVQK